MSDQFLEIFPCRVLINVKWLALDFWTGYPVQSMSLHSFAGSAHSYSHELTGSCITVWLQSWDKTHLFRSSQGLVRKLLIVVRVGNCHIYIDNHLKFWLWSSSIELIRYVVIKKCSGMCPSTCFKKNDKENVCDVPSHSPLTDSI